MSSRLRTVGRIAAIGALSVLLASCLKLDMDLEVSSDDTVSGTVIFAVRSEIVELAGGSVEDLFTDAPLPVEVPGVSVEPYEDEAFVGQQFTYDSVPLDRFNTGDDPDQLRIERDGEVFRISGALDLTTGEDATGPTGFDPTQLLEGAELRIAVTFPGEVTSSNGRIDGNTVTWEPELGERLELEATAGASDGGGVPALLLIGGAAVILVAALAVIASRGRRSPAGPAESPPPTPH